MRRFCISLLLVLLPTGALAQSPREPVASTAPALYKRAVANLDEGHWFESAIADLTTAVRQEPKNPDYHLALGCAEVDRAGSLAYAAFATAQYQNDQREYPKLLAEWQAAQQNPEADGNGSPAPVPPPGGLRFRTKDDLTTLHLTGKQAAARITALGQAAQVQWKQAVVLTSDPVARAQAESVQGWGLRYERLLLRYTQYPENKVPGAPKDTDVIAAFKAATKDDPNSAAYWEGLGDAYSIEFDSPAEQSRPIRLAWQKSLALKPNNTNLRYRLFLLQMKPDPKGALKSLTLAAQSDPGNSYLQYELAGLLFKQVHYSDVHDTASPQTENQMTKEQLMQSHNLIAQKLADKDDAASEKIADDALAAIERGNAGRRFAYLDYTPPVPKILWHAWDYWSILARLDDFDNIIGMSRLRELARATGGYAVVAAHRGDEEEGSRAAQDCIDMGLKMAGDWPVRDSSPDSGDLVQGLVGIALTSIGYSDLQQVYIVTGDSTMAQIAAAEYAAFQARKKAYIAATAAEFDQEQEGIPLYEYY